MGIVSAGYTAETGELAIQLDDPIAARVVRARPTRRAAARRTLDLAIYCGDDRQRVSCEATQRIDLTLGAEPTSYSPTKGTTMRRGFARHRRPRYVKVIVYDYAADVLGTAVWKKK